MRRMLFVMSACSWMVIAGGAQAGEPLAFDTPGYWAALDTLAVHNGVRAEDFRVDPAALDLVGGYSDRLPLARYLMAAPLRAPATVEGLARSLTKVDGQDDYRSVQVVPMVQLWLLLGGGPAVVPRDPKLEAAVSRIPEFIPAPDGKPRAEDAAGLIDSAMELLFMGSGKRYQGRLREAVLRESASLDPVLAQRIARVLIASARAADARDAILAKSELERGGFMGSRSRTTSRALMHHLTAPVSRVRLADARVVEAEITRRLDSIDVDALGWAAVALAAELDAFAANLIASDRRDFQTEWSTPRGRVAIGGAGPNTYRGDYLLVVDLGGDDAYEGPGSVSGELPVSIVFDAGGNDRYAAVDADSPGPGGAVLGYAAVYDLGEGDDTYSADACGAGFGLAGVGWVVDAGGNDRYTMRMWCEGAASHGIGLLVDEGGRDFYGAGGKGTASVQGFGGPRGVGALIDLGGDDEYRSGAPGDTVVTTEGWLPTWLTLGQGGAAGRWPGESGGIGLLIDAAGNDVYRGGTRAQGAGFNGGVGALVDLGGDDVYAASGQAQGLDQGIGLLLDAGGDDLYQAKGSDCLQGVGTDLGLGMLADVSGDDKYAAWGLAASKSHGAGFVIDLGGVDEYSVLSNAAVASSSLQGIEPLRALSRGVAVIIDLGSSEPRGEGDLVGLPLFRPEHEPAFNPRRCLGGLYIDGRVFPPLVH